MINVASHPFKCDESMIAIRISYKTNFTTDGVILKICRNNGHGQKLYCSPGERETKNRLVWYQIRRMFHFKWTIRRPKRSLVPKNFKWRLSLALAKVNVYRFHFLQTRNMLIRNVVNIAFEGGRGQSN